MNIKHKFQKGVSLVEGMTAAGVLGLAVTVFMTLQSHQERDFANLRKFDKAAYAVELMFEELAAVYNPVAKQYGNPRVFEDTLPGATVKVKGLAQLPDDGDQIIIEGVGGRYEITDSTSFDDDNNTTLTLERSDLDTDNDVNLSLAAGPIENANITFVSNSEGSLDPYNSLDMTKFENTEYKSLIINQKVLADLENWGALLKKHLGPPRDGDKRLIEVSDIERSVPVDNDNDGIIDQKFGEDHYELVKKKQVTITIKQDNIEEQFRRLFLAGT